MNSRKPHSSPFGTTEIFDKIQALENQRKEFDRACYIVTHDLKSPLNTIRMASEMILLKNKDKMDDKTESLMQIIETSTQNLERTINGLNRFCKCGQLKDSDFTLFTFDDILKPNEVYNIPIRWSITSSTGIETIFGSKSAMTEVLHELASNAVRYSSEAEVVIDVFLYPKNGRTEIILESNSSQIPSDQSTQIFEIFTTLNTLDRFETKGEGIGLAVARRLVQSIHGEISHEPLRPRTAFKITLPSNPPAISN
jgi:light-regulated signal transduction histidine kinase (bacteriophytochrome)